MSEITTVEIKEYLARIQGREVTLAGLRKEFNVLSGTKSFNLIRSIMYQLAEQRIVRPTGKRDGSYKVIMQVEPVRVFIPERERLPPVDLKFPRDYLTKLTMSWADSVVIREGDVITLGGVKSSGKTALCINFCAENIDKHPVLMGNEYTKLVENKYVPAPRFLMRLDAMDWVEWVDSDCNDKFTLLPVREDYAEHIVKDRVNIIDWINIDADRLFDISHVLENIKANLGKGIAIVALQKGEGANNPRGGQFVRDFSDLEILLDSMGDDNKDVLLTIKGVKESTSAITGRTYGYTLKDNGVKIINFREVKKCPDCNGDGYNRGKICERCYGRKYIDK